MVNLGPKQVWWHINVPTWGHPTWHLGSHAQSNVSKLWIQLWTRPCVHRWDKDAHQQGKVCSLDSLSIPITFFHLSVLTCLSESKLCPVATEVINKIIDLIASFYKWLQVLELSNHCSSKPQERNGQLLSIIFWRKREGQSCGFTINSLLWPLTAFSFSRLICLSQGCLNALSFL